MPAWSDGPGPVVPMPLAWDVAGCGSHTGAPLSYGTRLYKFSKGTAGQELLYSVARIEES